MEIQTEITRKDLNFINDIDLRDMLIERLKEMDRVFLVNGNYSTIFLALSTIEGIFKHVAAIFKGEIRESSIYPKNLKGNRKNFEKLTLNELHELLVKIGILPDIKNFNHVYQIFKDYRNFIHPQVQKKKDWAIDIGQAQMALGLLNATIDNLAQNIFIEKEIFKKWAGNPDYYSNRLHLNRHRTRLHSFLAMRQPLSNILSLKFDLELSKDSIFNFVFNFVDDGNFKMLRLDNRKRPATPNCVLHCTQKDFWKIILYANPPCPPQKDIFSVAIEINFQNKTFSFNANGDAYIFKDAKGNQKSLYNELKPNLKIGFFNEVGPVKLSKIRINITA